MFLYIFLQNASGHSNRIDVAVRRAVITGLNQLTGQVQGANAEKLGAEKFEVTWHSTARPTHQPWQGRVYTKEELVSVCGLGEVDGLKGANCRHDYFPFIEGISERVYTDEQLEEMNRKENEKKAYGGKEYTAYEATQRQRYLETAIRAQRQKIKLLQEGNASDDDIISAKCKYQKLSQEYTNFSKAMDLPQERSRIYSDGLGKVDVKLPKVKKQVASSGNSGIIAEESSQKKTKESSFAVDWSVVDTEEYDEAFDKLSSNPKVSKAIKTRAKWALSNRDLSQTEEIYATSLNSGEEIGRITTQHNISAVKRTKRFTDSLNLTDKKGEQIILIHNHPKGLPPSISDINVLLQNENVCGITVGHNGSVYYYTKPNNIITQDDWDVTMMHFKKYSEITAMEKSLEILSKAFEFEFIKIL